MARRQDAARSAQREPDANPLQHARNEEPADVWRDCEDGGGQCDERTSQLVRVLAGAARLPQRGTVIDQDTHLFKSF